MVVDLRTEGVGFEWVRDMLVGRGELWSVGNYDDFGACCSIARDDCTRCHWTSQCIVNGDRVAGR